MGRRQQLKMMEGRRGRGALARCGGLAYLWMLIFARKEEGKQESSFMMPYIHRRLDPPDSLTDLEFQAQALYGLPDTVYDSAVSRLPNPVPLHY